MNSYTFSWFRFASPLLVAATITGAPVVRANIIVANNGTDSSSCGSSASPCRSISQAIENAASGDTIWVGPGIYGDLNGDGKFDAPGSEHATVFTSGFDYDACVICITKTVNVFSYAGAATTTIQAGPNSISPTTVYIAANKTVFGAKGHGFTITGGNTNGVVVDLSRGGGAAGGMTVAGNIDLKDRNGFVVNGEEGAITLPNSCPPIIPNPCPPPIGTVLLLGNQAIGNATGFFIEPKLAAFYGTQPYLLQDNQAIGAGTGFFVDPGSVECDDCFDAGRAQVVTLTRNFAANSGIGFNLRSTGLVSDNVATNNSIGFEITDIPTFVRNSAMGNAGPGALVGFLLGGPVNVVTLTQNNFWGNDRNRPPLTVGVFPFITYSAGPSAHCGVLNVGAAGFNSVIPNIPQQVPTASVQAVDTYWGSANGPQPNGPGDTAGGVCDKDFLLQQDTGVLTTPSITTVKPYATAPNGTPTPTFGP